MTKEPTLKLSYDVPARIKEMLVQDANKEGITATQLLIRLLDSSKLTKDELIKAILTEYDVEFKENTIKAMNEAFRTGFLRGEDYGKNS